MTAVAHDFDGVFYVVGQQGEIEGEFDHRRVVVPVSASRIFGLNQTVLCNNRQNLEAVNHTLALNFWYLLSLPDDKRPTVEEARRIAFLRVHALTKGLGDMAQNLAAHNVRYSDIAIVPDDEEYVIAIGNAALDGNRGRNSVIPNWNADEEWREDVLEKVTNMICMVAYFMRVRGHHWTADSDSKYAQIWRNCLYEEDNPGLNWDKIAHHTYHFIYPDVLDEFWENAVENAHCAGTLAKRFDSLPAGVAAVGAVMTGVNDLLIVLPNIRNLVPAAFQELDRCANVIRGHRWAGSINRRFYNGPELVVDEKKLGSIAAVIIGCMQAVVSAAPLRNSRALQRVASNAPITGALFSTMIQKAVTDDRMVEGLFVEAEGED